MREQSLQHHQQQCFKKRYDQLSRGAFHEWFGSPAVPGACSVQCPGQSSLSRHCSGTPPIELPLQTLQTSSPETTHRLAKAKTCPIITKKIQWPWPERSWNGRLQKRFKISIRHLKCNKCKKVLNKSLIATINSKNLEKYRKISKHLKKSRGDKRNNHFNNSMKSQNKSRKKFENSRNVRKYAKISKKMQKHNFTRKLERDMTAAVSCVQLLG